MGTYLGTNGNIDGPEASPCAALLDCVHAVGNAGVGLTSHNEDRDADMRASRKLYADGLFLHTWEFKRGDDFIASAVDPQVGADQQSEGP